MNKYSNVLWTIINQQMSGHYTKQTVFSTNIQLLKQSFHLISNVKYTILDFLINFLSCIDEGLLTMNNRSQDV